MNEELSTIEIDLSDYSKEALIYFIVTAHANNRTFNEQIVHILETYIEANNLDNQPESE